MSKLQRVVTLVPTGSLNHNLLPTFMGELGQAFSACGLDHIAIDSNSADFLSELLRHATDPHTAIYAGHRFYDLGLVYADASGDRRENLFEVLQRPVFARLADHPFSRFMWSRIGASSRTTHFLTPTMEFQTEAQCLNPALRNFHKVRPSLTVQAPPAEQVPPLAERSIDLFMPCSFNNTNPSLQDLLAYHKGQGSPMAKVIEEVIEVAQDDVDRPIFDTFRSAMERNFGRPFSLGLPLSQADEEALLAVSSIDVRIRTLRRFEVLKSLAQLNPSLRIVITADPRLRENVDVLRNCANLDFIGKVDASRTRELYLSSKYVINVNPSYVSLVSERVRNAMAFGCCVISDKNSHIAEVFAEGREILFMEGWHLGGLNDFLCADVAEAQAIASRGRQRVLADSSIAHLADDIIAVMNEVL